MSYVRFNVSDRTETISGELHGSMTEPMIASLSAEPETLEEFEFALNRYLLSESDWPPLHGFRRYENFEPYDAGIVAIDLVGRTVGHQTNYSYPCPEGSVRVPGAFADDGEDVLIPYRISSEWKFTGDMLEYQCLAANRRRERLARRRIDPRQVLYGYPLLACIAHSISGANDLEREELLSDIHAAWLMAPLEELEGRTPREVLLEKKDLIDFDLHTRALQWSFTKVCPPPLKTSFFAYRHAGFGTHEWVLYYELIRHLLRDSAERRLSGGPIDVDVEAARLATVRDEWMRTPDTESYDRVPADMIDLERRRMNITLTSKEILIDENCPCCVALAEDFDTPMFWHLDGCNMDERFEFSDFATIEEYEADIRRREAFQLEYDDR